MRAAGRIVAETLALLKTRIIPGVTTNELNRLAEKECQRHGAKPAFKGYGGFPISPYVPHRTNRLFMVSLTMNPLLEGDILSIDFGVLYKGFLSVIRQSLSQ